MRLLQSLSVCSLLGVVLAAGLNACSSQPLRNGALDSGWAMERRVLQGIAQVHATPEQRTAILASFDTVNPELRALEEQEQQLGRNWSELDAKQGGYPALAQDLLEQRVRYFRKRLELEFEFDRTVAQVLDKEQWSVWRISVRRGEHDFGAGPGGPGRGRDAPPRR